MLPSRLKAKIANIILQFIDLVLVFLLFIGLRRAGDGGYVLDWMSLAQINLSLGSFVTIIVMAFVWRFIFIISDMYQFRRLEGWGRRAGRVVFSCALSVMALILIANLSGIRTIDWNLGLVLWFWTSIIFLFLRISLFLALATVRSKGRNIRNVVIIGLNDRSLALYQSMKANRLGLNFVGFIDDYKQGQPVPFNTDLSYLCSLEGFAGYISINPVDYVLLALPIRSHYDQISRIINQCAVQGIQTWLLTDLFDLPPNTSFKVDRLFQVTFVNYFNDPHSETYYVVKRLMDVILSVCALIALSPVLLLISILIVMNDGFPVIFAQDRVGLNKRYFKMFKFRTMVKNAEKLQSSLEAKNIAGGAAFKMADDPRVTKLGKFLRRTSLDELPQFINVFLGSMTLVGPRPLPRRDFERFYNDSHRLRFSVKPGLTCMWQISGRSDVDFEEWMRLDSFYVQNASLLLDLSILLRTFRVVLSHKGAY